MYKSRDRKYIKPNVTNFKLSNLHAYYHFLLISTGFKCSTDWKLHNSHCYELFENSSALTWLDSEQVCKENDASLTSINSATEAEFIHFLSVDHRESWIYIGE